MIGQNNLNKKPKRIKWKVGDKFTVVRFDYKEMAYHPVLGEITDIIPKKKFRYIYKLEGKTENEWPKLCYKELAKIVPTFKDISIILNKWKQ